MFLKIPKRQVFHGNKQRFGAFKPARRLHEASIKLNVGQLNGLCASSLAWYLLLGELGNCLQLSIVIHGLGIGCDLPHFLDNP